MATLAKSKKTGLSPDNLNKLQDFIEDVKTRKMIPFEEKTERAKKNLRKAGLIK